VPENLERSFSDIEHDQGTEMVHNGVPRQTSVSVMKHLRIITGSVRHGMKVSRWKGRF
jgi:hypothetical protein